MLQTERASPTRVSLKTEDGKKINATFQVCKTNRPLWSVGKICDSGCKVIFSMDRVEVVHEKSGKRACSFQRQGGLYVATLKLGRPQPAQPFTGQGRR